MKYVLHPYDHIKDGRSKITQKKKQKKRYTT